MNLLQGKSNQYLREAILEESLEKVKRYLTLKIGKADVSALTEVCQEKKKHCIVFAFPLLCTCVHVCVHCFRFDSLVLAILHCRAAGSVCCIARR